jgi:hypothetical protein
MSKKIVKSNPEDILNEIMSSLSLKLDEMNNSLTNRITHMEEKLDLIMKRQSDIEEKIVYRVEKNTLPNSNSYNSMTDIDTKDNDTNNRVILLKEKTTSSSSTTTRKTKKKVSDTSSSNTQVNKRGNIVMKVYKDIVLLTGQTFDRKELIKQYSGKWDNKNMGWTVPLGKHSELKLELERYTESLDYDEMDEYLNEPVTVVKKSGGSLSSFNTCQIVDSDDD